MPFVDSRILQKSMASTPREVTSAISALCRDINVSNEPIFIKVIPDPGAIHSECFHNVRNKVQKEGGEILYGWAIWEWPRVFIEAEHHAVWRRGEEIVDVTPHQPAADRILFMRDQDRAYDFAEHRRQQNQRRSLGKIVGVSEWIEASQTLAEFIERNSVGRVVNVDKRELEPIRDRVLDLQARIYVALAENTKRNDRCFCASGRKFKACCGPLIDLRR